jgi:hypothetical protein
MEVELCLTKTFRLSTEASSKREAQSNLKQILKNCRSLESIFGIACSEGYLGYDTPEVPLIIGVPYSMEVVFYARNSNPNMVLRLSEVIETFAHINDLEKIDDKLEFEE